MSWCKVKAGSCANGLVYQGNDWDYCWPDVADDGADAKAPTVDTTVVPTSKNTALPVAAEDASDDGDGSRQTNGSTGGSPAQIALCGADACERQFLRRGKRPTTYKPKIDTASADVSA